METESKEESMNNLDSVEKPRECPECGYPIKDGEETTALTVNGVMAVWHTACLEKYKEEEGNGKIKT